MDGRICECSEYGQHIVVRCKDHHNSLYSTKNIAPIGCRGVFHVSGLDCPCQGTGSLEHVCMSHPWDSKGELP